jgi:hypothetical protein
LIAFLVLVPSSAITQLDGTPVIENTANGNPAIGNTTIKSPTIDGLKIVTTGSLAARRMGNFMTHHGEREKRWHTG